MCQCISLVLIHFVYSHPSHAFLYSMEVYHSLAMSHYELIAPSPSVNQFTYHMEKREPTYYFTSDCLMTSCKNTMAVLRVVRSRLSRSRMSSLPHTSTTRWQHWFRTGSHLSKVGFQGNWPCFIFLVTSSIAGTIQHIYNDYGEFRNHIRTPLWPTFTQWFALHFNSK